MKPLTTNIVMSFHTSDIEPTTPEIFGRVSVGLFMLFSFAVRSSLTASEAEIWSTGVGIDGFLYSFIATRKHLVKEDTYCIPRQLIVSNLRW